ncbi:MAG: hypothetical protein HY403_05315 [Elusimicrobia bacterium]|nr:hypothetical protein [Elusimicrobiota bacterium]
MLTRDDLIDIIIAGAARAPRSGRAPGRAPAGRVFLSEYDIRKRLTPGDLRLTIPRSAILSPLAADWLVLKGIEVIRELP